MSDNLIETTNLTKRFGDLVAVNSINIKIKKGTIHGFIGPNGAGKSTTMKMLIGALKPSSGTGLIKGSKIGSLETRKVFGFSPEHPKFYDNMNSYDYLVYIGRVSGLGGKKSKERAKELLEWLDLADTQVTDAGLEHLKGLTKLEELYLAGPQVSDAGLEHLKGLTSLQHLYLSGEPAHELHGQPRSL